MPMAGHPFFRWVLMVSPGRVEQCQSSSHPESTPKLTSKGHLESVKVQPLSIKHGILNPDVRFALSTFG